MHKRNNRRPGRKPARRPVNLTDCPSCLLPFVYPVEWEEKNEDDWWMLLRCGNCHERREVIVTQEEADRFDDGLDACADELVAVIGRIQRESMERDIERFVSALDADAILPEDF